MSSATTPWRLADQGILQGQANSIKRNRCAVAAVQIWADVAVKHSVALGDRSLEDEGEDTVERGLADAVIVSGTSSGKLTALEHLRVRRCGAGEATLDALLEVADRAIIGTAFKRGGAVSAPVDTAQVRASS